MLPLIKILGEVFTLAVFFALPVERRLGRPVDPRDKRH